MNASSDLSGTSPCSIPLRQGYGEQALDDQRSTIEKNLYCGSTSHRVQVDRNTKNKPGILFQLNDWEYLERSLHRLVAAWGRNFSDWDDKSAVQRHVWEEAECVRRLRERIGQFPGGKPGAVVSSRLEKLVNTVLLAPSLEDAVDGIYQVLTGALVKAYLDHAQNAHPVHDAPTIQMLHELVTLKEQQRLWLRDYRRRHPHRINRAYQDAIGQELANCNHLQHALPAMDDPAEPAGTRTTFRLLRKAGRPAGSMPQKHLLMPYLEIDFKTSIESRRLFWMYGYMLEKNLADDQLRWIYDGHFMPWDFAKDISRHLWDESRHGDSGHSRLLDFGITLQEIGFPSYESEQPDLLKDRLDPMSPKDLYETIFFIGMVAETGHFEVKNEAYQDFKEGGDLESAEMMLFDIIDETTHVQYAHRWLPVLAGYAGMDNSDYRERALQVRRQKLKEMEERVERLSRELPRSAGNPDYDFYQGLLRRLRDQKPLSNARTCPPRSMKPM